jgi:hypothetical protein
MIAMRPIYRWLGWQALRGFVWLVSLPTVVALGLVRLWASRPLLGDAVSCRTCGSDISLVGLWECGRCGYSWHGWYFSRCEYCGDVPPFLVCDQCGASMMNPLIFKSRKATRR